MIEARRGCAAARRGSSWPCFVDTQGLGAIAGPQNEHGDRGAPRLRRGV